MFILLWSRVIFFKFFNPLNACKCIFVCVFIFIQLDFLSGRFPHFLRQLEIPPDLSSLDTFSLVKTSEIILISFYCYYLVFLIYSNHCQWVQIKTSSSNPPIDGEGGMRVNPCIGAHPTAAAAHRDPAIHLFLIIISIRPAFPCNGYWKVSNRNISWVTSHALALHLWSFAQRQTYFPSNHHIVPLRQNHIHRNR